MKKQLTATLLAAAGFATLAICMTGCDTTKASPISKPVVEKAKTATAPAAMADPAMAKPKDHPAH